MQPNRVVLMFIIALPVIAYWFFYFAPPPKDWGHDWARFSAMMIMAILSLPALALSLYYAVRKRNSVIWWALVVVTLTPMIVFFVG